MSLGFPVVQLIRLYHLWVRLTQFLEKLALWHHDEVHLKGFRYFYFLSLTRHPRFNQRAASTTTTTKKAALQKEKRNIWMSSSRHLRQDNECTYLQELWYEALKILLFVKSKMACLGQIQLVFTSTSRRPWKATLMCYIMIISQIISSSTEKCACSMICFPWSFNGTSTPSTGRWKA